MGFLERMAQLSRERVAAARRASAEPEVLAAARAAPEPIAIERRGFDVIAELKLRSPAVGGLADAGFDRAAQLEAYARGGAAAVSVLTEPVEFKGSLDHLREAATLLRPLGCPVMRKDFLTDPYQVAEARAAGASGVLVIVTMLSDDAARRLVERARELGLFVLLEGFDARDLERIARLAPPGDEQVLAGVNCRNLKTLHVDFARFAELAAALPAELPTVAESGIASPGEVAEVAGLGYRLALVGSALMREGAPERTLAELIAAGRSRLPEAARCS